MTCKSADIRVYTTPACGYCRRAKQLLEQKGLDYTEIDVSRNEEALAEITALSTQKTFPQIMINGRVIGGYNELANLDSQGQLDALVG
ncbi:MAG: glutaredoxin 3 [Deltaproteobacteria bacterium]